MSDLTSDLAQRMYTHRLSAPECDAVVAVVEAAKAWVRRSEGTSRGLMWDHQVLLIEAVEALEALEALKE
jgi:hypothetical protein